MLSNHNPLPTSPRFYARTPRHRRLHRSVGKTHRRAEDRDDSHRQPIVAPNCCAPVKHGGGQASRKIASNRQAHLHRTGRRFVARPAPHDRRTPALARAWREAGASARPCRFRLRGCKSVMDGSWLSKTGLTLLHCGRGESSLTRSRWAGSFRREPRTVCSDTDFRQSHFEAGAHRSAYVQWNRKCLLRRDSFRSATLAAAAHTKNDATADPAAPRGYSLNLAAMDRSATNRNRGQIPGESDRLSRPDGHPRQVQATVSALRPAHPAPSLRRERSQLLSILPDRRQAACRPLALAAVARRLAEDSGSPRILHRQA